MMRAPDDVTVLIVEDDAATSEFFVDLLGLYGYTTLLATSGAAALTQVAQHPVGIVLLDRRLPDMDGLEVCRQIRKSINASVPIILLTADYEPELQKAAHEAGVSAYLSKPFQPEALLERIASLLRQ